MTLTQINKALGQDWFQGGDGVTKIFYADEADVQCIELAKVFHVEETGEHRTLWEYTGDGELPTEVTEEMENGEDEDVTCHGLNKYQARGCYQMIEARIFLTKEEYHESIEHLLGDIYKPGMTREAFEEEILNNPVGEDIFGDLKGLYAEEEDLDPDDESEEQELNEMVWQDFYQVLNTPFKSHYGAD